MKSKNQAQSVFLLYHPWSFPTDHSMAAAHPGKKEMRKENRLSLTHFIPEGITNIVVPKIH